MDWERKRCEEGREEGGRQSVCKVLAANKKWPHPSLSISTIAVMSTDLHRLRSFEILPPSFRKGLQLEHVFTGDQCWFCLLLILPKAVNSGVWKEQIPQPQCQKLSAPAIPLRGLDVFHLCFLPLPPCPQPPCPLRYSTDSYLYSANRPTSLTVCH